MFFNLAGILIVFLIYMTSGANAQKLDAPYVSTPKDVVEKMMDMADVGPGDYVIDPGCGDGRIVIAAAKRGAVGHGVDLNPKRVKEARKNAREAGVSDRVTFVEEDLFETDYSRATVIAMYLLTTMMADLRPSFMESLEPGTRIVSHDFDMGPWEPDKYKKMGGSDNKIKGWRSGQLLKSKSNEIFYWVIPSDMEGEWNWKMNGRKYSMVVEQKFQKIDPLILEENDTLSVKEKLIKGDRISFKAVNQDDEIHYVFNGQIDEDQIEGKVQIRSNTSNIIKNWSATKK
ncbi:MAG: class I SAM-dependent methyltransferase [Bacteroidota bacterium]